MRDGSRWLVEAEGHVWQWYVRVSCPRVMNRDAPESSSDAGQEKSRLIVAYRPSGGRLHCLRRSSLDLLEHMLSRACGKIEELFRLFGCLCGKLLEELCVQFQCFW